MGNDEQTELGKYNRFHLQRELVELRQENERLKHLVTHWQTRFDALETKFHDTRTELQQAREEIVRLKQEAADDLLAFNHANEVILKQEETITQIQQQLAQSQESLQTMIEENNDNINERNHYIDQCRKLDEQRDALQARLDEAVGLLKEWRVKWESAHFKDKHCEVTDDFISGTTRTAVGG